MDFALLKCGRVLTVFHADDVKTAKRRANGYIRRGFPRVDPAGPWVLRSEQADGTLSDLVRYGTGTRYQRCWMP